MSAAFVPAELNDLSVDVSLTSPARGQLFFRGASKWNNLAVGTAGQLLQSNGAGANPSWVAAPTAVGADHGLLAGLTDDDHAQYAMLAGRAGVNLFTGVNQLPAGSVAATSIRGPDSAGQGLYFPTGGLALATGGVLALGIDSNRRVGIRTTAPDTTLHVFTASCGTFTPNANAADFMIESNGPGGMTIAVPDASLGNIFFGTPTDTVAALVQWDFTNNVFKVASSRSAASLVLGSGDNVTAVTIASNANSYFGRGITDATPGAYTLNGTGGLGTDIAGGALQLAGGRGTGAGVGGGILFQTAQASTTGTGLNTLITRLTIGEKGNLIMGTAALATTATDGFLHITSCPGTPTGVPTAYTGRVPMVYDSTNNKIYVYNGGWKATAALA